MKVNELMTQEPRTCTPDTSVAEAAHLMWEADCGILPVVDDGELVGVVTDRDMYIALATQDARAAHLRVGAVATKKVVTCVPEDDVETALAAMRDARVRRLPVVGFGNTVVGLLSMNDIVLASGSDKPYDPRTSSRHCERFVGVITVPATSLLPDADPEGTLAFLRSPGLYPDAPKVVVVKETHMSWVFVTDEYAYKLKKAIRLDDLDLATSELRRRGCEEEVRLNRRLAPDVYLGVSAISRTPAGTLALDGKGRAIDWVVRMRRLPAERMLDALIEERRARGEEGNIRVVARYLARFFAAARPEAVSPRNYCTRLERGVREDVRALLAPRYGLSRERLETLARAQLQLLDRNPPLFERRVQAGRIVEGHGDLRPEHICVRGQGAIIDCLEFSRDLRVLDPLDELAFLALECERLGDARVGQWFLDEYSDVTGDEAPAALLHFYRVYRALRRANIAVRHLDDPTMRDPERFAARARQYLELVEPVTLGSESKVSQANSRIQQIAQ